jgi:hypothetical protein
MNSNTKESIVPANSIVERCISPVYRPIIHGDEVWNTILPDAYTKYMKEWKNKVVSLKKHSEGGMVVPFEVQDDPAKGRGLYATKDIKKGTRVWTSAHFHYFNSEEDFLEFLKYLPHNLQCEIILWTYPVADTTSQVAIPFDEGVYMNDGGPGSSRNNIESYTTTAIYDIKAGEELLQDYTDFIDLDHEVAWFDQLRERAFGRYNYTQQGAPPSLEQHNKNNVVHSGNNLVFHEFMHDTQPILGRAVTSIKSGCALLIVLVILKTSLGLSKVWSRKHHGH